MSRSALRPQPGAVPGFAELTPALVGEFPAACSGVGVGVEAVCAARWYLGSLSFRPRYVTFRRPTLAAVVLVGRPPLFEQWAASIRADGRPGRLR